MKKILESFKLILIIKTYKALLLIVRFVSKIAAKKTSRCYRLLREALQYCIRYEYKLGLIGDNKEVDRLISVIICLLLNESLNEEDNAFSQLHADEIQIIQSSLLKNIEIRELISLVFQTEVIRKKFINDAYNSLIKMRGHSPTSDEAYNTILDKARSFSTNIFPLKLASIKKINKKTKSISSEYRTLITDNKGIKISFNLNSLSKIFAASTGIFLFGGYIYNKILLGHYGININYYFSVSDYISSSIDKVGDGLLSAAVSLGSVFLGANSRSRMPNEVRKLQTNDNILNLIICGFFTLIIINLILPHTKSGREFVAFYYSNALLMTQLASMVIILKLLSLLCRRFFNNPVQPFFLIFFCLYFVISVSCSAWSTAINYDYKTSAMLEKQSKATLYPSILHNSKLLILTVNSQYYFFLNTDNHRAFVLPKSKIE